MDPVSVLVFNALAKRQGINLPGVGALHVVTSAARTEERNTLVPPVNRVELLPDAQPGFLDVIDLLARYGETDRDDAQQTYNSWLAQVSSEEGVTIDSVGLVSEGTFRPAPQMAAVLNPGRDRSDAVAPEGKRQRALVVDRSGHSGRRGHIGGGHRMARKSRCALSAPDDPDGDRIFRGRRCSRGKSAVLSGFLIRDRDGYGHPNRRSGPRSLRPPFPAFRPPDKSATT